MNTISTKKILLGVGLLGALTLTSSLSPASARPRQNADVKAARQDVKEARRDVRQERRDVRQADTREERRNAKQDVNRAQRDLQREQAQLRNQRQQGRPGGYNRPGYNNNGGYNNGGYNNGSYNNSGGYYNNGYNNNGGYNNGGYGQSYTGQVTNVRSGQSFDVNINGNTFNVYTVSNVPRGLSVGDVVRINGIQQYNNDIRQASVSVLRNR